MVNLNMIDTIGSGIKRMFLNQRERFFPMPDYDLSELNRVRLNYSIELVVLTTYLDLKKENGCLNNQ